LSLEFGGLTPKVGGVSSSKYRVRRATLDDIGQLTAIWESMQYPTQELARRVTEFQVAECADGKILGAVGVQMAERQGLLHSEAFSDFALAEHLRPLLWDRVQTVATNHGLLRVWTQEQAPFWNHCGLLKADADALQKLPASIARRREIVQWYNDAFCQLLLVQPLTIRGDRCSAHHLYVLNFDLPVPRQQILNALRCEGIGGQVHYRPVHLQPYYRKTFGTKEGLCPLAEAAAERIISLPLFPSMSDGDVQNVIDAVRKVCEAFA